MSQKPPPVAKCGHVVCSVRAAGVNPVDAKFVIGDKLPESWMGWCARRVSGRCVGFDFSGVVVSAPDGCGFAPGDEVYGFAAAGSFAETVSAPLDQIAKKTSTLTFLEAAALPLVGVTAAQAFEQHGLASGQRLLVIGASGGVGHVAVQVAHMLGARVVGICSGLNADFVLQCGAEAVIDYSDGDVFEKIALECAAHGAYDMVLDCVSSASSVDEKASYRARIEAMNRRSPSPIVKAGGGADGHNYVVLGGRTSQWLTAGVKRSTGLNLFPAGFELFWIQIPGAARTLATLTAMVEKQGLRPKIDRALPFTEAGIRESFDSLLSRRTAGKIVLDLSEPA